MKNTLSLFVVALMSVTMYSQSVNFKIGFKPNTTYKQTNVQNVTSAVGYGEGSEPMEQKSDMTMTSTTVTGKLKGTEMPVTVTLAVEPGSEAAAVIPEGTKLYGKAQNGGIPKFDSIHSPGMDVKVKQMMLGMMESNYSQMMFPEKTLKVGDSFVVDTPLSMPMGPITINMNIKSTYKLKKVEGKKAFIDINQVYTMDTKVEGQDLKGSGTGTGEMVYDIDHKYPTQLNTNTTMSIAMDAGGMMIDIKNTTISKNTTTITTTK